MDSDGRELNLLQFDRQVAQRDEMHCQFATWNANAGNSRFLLPMGQRTTISKVQMTVQTPKVPFLSTRCMP